METIDSGLITDSQVDINYKNGFSFGFGLRMAIGVLGGLGFLALLSGGAGFIIAPILLTISVYVNTSTYGTDISLENNYIKSYTRSFGIKKGKWVSTFLLPDLTILKMGKGMSINQVFGPGQVNIKSDVYDIYILSKNHRKRILLKECDSNKDAFIEAQRLSEKMKKNFVNFNPTISQATRARRYERH